MKQKSLGQVACDEFNKYSICVNPWSISVRHKEWNRAAKAVIREYLKRQKAGKKK